MEDTEPHKEFQIMMQRIVQMELKLQTVKKIAIVKKMLKQSKKIDDTQQYLEHLNKIVAAGRANLSTYNEISESEESIRERILNFFESAAKYIGNPEKVRCESLETHLWNNSWETIPNEAVKSMLFSSITKSATTRDCAVASYRFSI